MAKVAIIGYGNQGRAQALCMRDSGMDVIIGARQGTGRKQAEKDGFIVYDIEDAAKKADIVHLLIPDEVIPDIFEKDIKRFIKGRVIGFSHGFSVVFGKLDLPKDIDVIMIAPYGTGHELRDAYTNKRSIPGLVAIHQDSSGKAKDIAFAMAKACMLSPVFETDFRTEVVLDLFGEQNVVCGGLVDIIVKGFEVLVEAGYPKELAYLETLNQIKMTSELIQKKGITDFNRAISNTAEWGQYVNGPRIIDGKVKQRMKDSLKDIENGTFAKGWLSEVRNGMPNLKKRREELTEHEVEIIGKKIRDLIALHR